MGNPLEISHPQRDPVSVLGQRPADEEQSFRTIFRPYWGRVSVGFLVLAGTTSLQLAMPRLINDGIDIAQRGHEGPTKGILGIPGTESAGIAYVAGAIVVAAVLAALLRVGSRMLLFNVGRDVERDLRRMLFGHLATLSPTYFGQNPTGDLMSRLTNDLTNVRLMAGFALLNLLNAGLFFVGTLPLLFSLDVRVSLAALIPFPLVLVFSRGMSRTMFRRTRENQEELGKLTSAVQENLAGQQVVRAFSRQQGESERFARVNEGAFQAAMRLAKVRLVMFPLTSLMGALGIAVTLYMAGHAIVEGRMDIGDFVEFNARLFQLTWPTIALGFIISVYQRGQASLERINGVLSAKPDIVDGAHRGDMQGDVQARGLTVVYPGQSRPALRDVHFQVTAGQTLGVVGRNASGKTSLVRALARLVPIPRGQLFFDGVDANEWHLMASRRGIAIVPDDGFLFSATLRENLCFGNPDVGDDELTEAIQVADLSRDVESFPEGLQTMVGERGVTLSGGQRQRVALARALLTRPRVLILDDSLSAVDAKTETSIVSALRAGRFSMGGIAPALLIISHRLSAVREADEILVLEEGAVIERGRHADLLERAGRYADLWGREQLQNRLSATLDEEQVS